MAGSNFVPFLQSKTLINICSFTLIPTISINAAELRKSQMRLLSNYLSQTTQCSASSNLGFFQLNSGGH